MSNYFSWLPKLGKAMPIPGGALYCTSIQVSRGERHCSGKIVLAFTCDTEFYDAGTDRPQELPAPPLALPPPSAI